MFYEAQHSLAADSLSIGIGQDLIFPPHLHGAFELIAVLEGEMTVRIEKETVRLTPGLAALVFPDQVHSLESVGHSRHVILIFSPSYVKTYSSSCAARIPVTGVFRPSETLLSMLCGLKKEDGILKGKGVLYTLCAEFDEEREYRERSREENALLSGIFGFVREHYAGDCSLKCLSSSLGYSYVYLSRYFKERTGLSFTEYVGDTRIAEACTRLTDSRDSVTKIALECGFSSLRSFHRAFRARTGLSPAQYRKKE